MRPGGPLVRANSQTMEEVWSPSKAPFRCRRGATHPEEMEHLRLEVEAAAARLRIWENAELH